MDARTWRNMQSTFVVLTSTSGFSGGSSGLSGMIYCECIKAESEQDVKELIKSSHSKVHSLVRFVITKSFIKERSWVHSLPLTRALTVHNKTGILLNVVTSHCPSALRLLPSFPVLDKFPDRDPRNMSSPFQVTFSDLNVCCRNVSHHNKVQMQKR